MWTCDVNIQTADICLASFVTVVLSIDMIKFKMKEPGKSKRYQSSRGIESLRMLILNARMFETPDHEQAGL